MKALTGLTVAGLALMGSMGLASAQYYGRDDGPRERGPRYDDRDYDRRGGGDRGYDRRGGGGGGGGYAFDEREYLRCNPDVRRAVAAGQMASGAAHFRQYGQRENRRTSC